MFIYFLIINCFLILINCNSNSDSYPPSTQHVVNSVGYFACDYGKFSIQRINDFYLSQHNKYDCREQYLEIAFPVEHLDKSQTASFGFLTKPKTKWKM